MKFKKPSGVGLRGVAIDQRFPKRGGVYGNYFIFDIYHLRVSGWKSGRGEKKPHVLLGSGVGSSHHNGIFGDEIVNGFLFL
ncbi:MAG: hypothetical protein EPN79_05365 [Burkholderiaceae bacterium]|nr:MAG: hypothetical protein EPN79_05365 [Burkholderiaceae bacterium]TBR75884.1 MAG: hypothetical protein EPN64_10475 [Burkholderiaceae bacterium]